ncbi:type II toxin-antitoxin system RelE/ParE family toxin [Pseudovibrio brasiliensis]|uniref:Toxin n=1 Tax=Pseudovibrio brasiliensis TaxID=1898042 RepID=A0ABX8ALI0_9HYPH|nr:type II toxin-antitoxin system RelE/ParE family toxin [Pseudovibrio brasiliensis]QUS55527.1 type II toxin-antitoxin system RelE/ParE family toxin [Pseudovibrio brasiliensis]
MRYRLTQKAKEDIIGIFLHGAAEFGEHLAQAYHQQMEQTFELIAQYPELAPERTEISSPVRIYPFKSHIIIYRVEENRNILIIRVRHGKEDWIAHPIEAGDH